MLASNTSTLVLLAKVGCLEAFVEMASGIEVPVQVKKEALFERDSYYAKVISKLIESKKLRVVEVEKGRIINVLKEFRLDDGEAAAYAIFDAKRHKAILTDDGELIKLCKLQKIPFVCAMAVIIVMFERKRLTRGEALSKLKELHEIGRYAEKLYEHFKNEVK